QICQTPISLITLVDDKRQWFKSAHGLSAQETPKEGGFCTHTVSHPTDLSIIEDARISDQFAAHPLVTGDPHIVFYAGAPLVDEQGFALGSLCVIDGKPRQLDYQQRTALKVLAKQVVNLLTLRKQNEELRQSRERYHLEKVALAQSEVRFRRLIEEAPVATALYVGPQFQVQVANQTMLRYWGKDASVIDQPLAEALPELAGQPFLGILADLFTTGQVYEEQAAPAHLIVNGQLTTFYFDYTYKPLRDELGQVYAIMNMAIDVTQQVIARQALEENQAALNNAVELAELGTWTLDIASGVTELSPHHATMFGLAMTNLSYEEAVAVVHPTDRERVRAAFESALQPGSDGQYQAEYRIVNATSGQQQVVRSRGRTSLDAESNPLRISGTTQDITLERGLQAALEQQVHQRTEELTASNEEYAAINEELEEANSLLVRSNENLQTFAYIASHDLQEPLRKIQQFGDLLRTRLADSIGSEDLAYLERMQVAASRMSTLMRDLLAFSRISTQRNTEELVSLADVVGDVVSVLDLVITETNAQVIIADGGITGLQLR
ncbi:MAG: PAS domain S-box protein, partial [Oxalobacteraceae bacterium]